jgi:hypothetical protein
MLAKGGMSDEVILSQIRNSHAAYRLSTADILDLKESGVSEKVIDFMINTASGSATPPSPPTMQPLPAPPPPSGSVEVAVGASPPPPVIESVTVAPGPDYLWIPGAWRWRHGRWVWFRGHWELPPRRGAIWITGGWEYHGGRTVWVDGYWR